MEKAPKIEQFDTVLHRPSGERWIVREINGDRLAWYGWPPGQAELSDCELIEKATPGGLRWLLEQRRGGERPDVCPGCGGPADSGHDRCLPPNTYYCTKCCDQWQGIGGRDGE